jgi:hypothetical protein
MKLMISMVCVLIASMCSSCALVGVHGYQGDGYSTDDNGYYASSSQDNAQAGRYIQSFFNNNPWKTSQQIMPQQTQTNCQTSYVGGMANTTCRSY